VVKFCRSAETAELFSPAWADVVAAAKAEGIALVEEAQ
jgi:hypothetical protein